MQPIQRRKSVMEKSNSFAGRELLKNDLAQLQREVVSEESSPHGSQDSLRDSSSHIPEANSLFSGQKVQLRTNVSDRAEKRGRRKSTSDIPVSIHGLWPSESLHSVCEDDSISDSSTGQRIVVSRKDIAVVVKNHSDASPRNTPPPSPLLLRTPSPASLLQSPNPDPNTLSVPIMLESTPTKVVRETESSHLVPSTPSDTPPDPRQSSSPSPTPPSIPTTPNVLVPEVESSHLVPSTPSDTPPDPRRPSSPSPTPPSIPTESETTPEVLVPETESSPMVPYLKRCFPVERQDKGVFVCGSLRLFNTKLDDTCIVTGFNTSISYSDPTTSLSELII